MFTVQKQLLKLKNRCYACSIFANLHNIFKSMLNDLRCISLLLVETLVLARSISMEVDKCGKKKHSSTDLDKIIGTPGIFVSSLTLALNFSLAKPNVFRISFHGLCHC